MGKYKLKIFSSAEQDLHQVLPTVELSEDDEGYFLCRTSECQTAYYRTDGTIYFKFGVNVV